MFQCGFCNFKICECITFKVQSSHVPNDSVSVLDFEMCVETLAIVYSTHRRPSPSFQNLYSFGITKKGKMKEMMEVKGEGRLDKVTEKKLRIGNKERKKEREKERKKERKKKDRKKER